jgi:hypothetical protein
LRRALAELDKGDLLMVTRLDRLARSTRYAEAIRRRDHGDETLSFGFVAVGLVRGDGDFL